MDEKKSTIIKHIKKRITELEELISKETKKGRNSEKGVGAS